MRTDRLFPGPATDLHHSIARLVTSAARGPTHWTGELIERPNISAELIEEMWRLWAQEFLLLGDREARRQHFLETCRDITSVGCVRDPDGTLAGFWSATTTYRTWDEVDFSQVHVHHYVIRSDRRGSAAPYLTAVRGFLRTFLGHPRRPIYVVAGTFPGSYIAIRSGPTRMTTLANANAWEAGLLRDVAASMGQEAWDPDTGLIHGHQIPRDSVKSYHPHGAHAQAFAEYERLNPTWREGTVIPVLVRVEVNPLKWALELAHRRGHTAYDEQDHAASNGQDWTRSQTD